MIKHACYSFVVIVLATKIKTCVDRLVVLLSSFLLPYFEAEVVYAFGVPVWCLEYAFVCIGCDH